MRFDIARVLKGVVAFNLMLMSASNANCSTEGTVSEPLETAVTVVNIISNIGWMYTAIRPVAKSAIEVFVPGSKPTIRNEITRHPIQRILYSNGLACVATVVSSFFNLYDRLSFSPIAGGAIPVVTLIGQGIIDVYKIYRRCTQGPFNPEELSFEDHLEYYKKLHPDECSHGMERRYRKMVLSSLDEDQLLNERKKGAEILVQRILNSKDGEANPPTFEKMKASLGFENLSNLYMMLMQDKVSARMLADAGAKSEDLTAAGLNRVQLYTNGVSAQQITDAGSTIQTEENINVEDNEGLPEFQETNISGEETHD